MVAIDSRAWAMSFSLLTRPSNAIALHATPDAGALHAVRTTELHGATRASSN
jgi:hypothetical protein